MNVSTVSDLAFGLMALAFAGIYRPVDIALFLAASVAAGLIFVGFAVIAGSLAFFMGNAQYASQQMVNGILTFAIYPNTLFTGVTRFVLYTIVPAAFIGAVPVNIVKGHDGLLLLLLWCAVAVIWAVAVGAFYTGVDMRHASAVVVGTEQYGLSQRWLEEADQQVKLPMFGQADSLNVAMSATLLVYEAVRQRNVENRR